MPIRNHNRGGKVEREIHRYGTHLWNVLMNIFRANDKGTVSITGSSSDGMRGGIYSNKSHHDYDASSYLYNYIFTYFLKFRINEFKNQQICLLLAMHYNLSYFTIDVDTYIIYNIM
jgi:hypothetical protein